MRQTCKMNVEVRAVIKYLCKKGMTPKAIYEDFIKTLGSYRTVKNGLQNLSVEERALRMMQGLATPKMPSLIVHNLVMCDRRRDLQSIASEVGISFGAVQTILTDILGMSKVSARRVPRILTDDQKRSRLDIYR